MRNVLGLAILVCSSAGCGDDAESFEPVDGACGTLEVPETPEPVAPECFGEPETECPPEDPAVGTSCGAPRSCTYDGEWTYDCQEGRWVDPSLDDGAPPLSEMCLEPFAGTLNGAQVLLGPASSGAFRPFADCEEHDLEWGPQGGAMLPFELRVVGTDLPACVAVRTRLAVGAFGAEASTARVALHCGESMLVYSVIPWELQRDLCGAPDTVVMKLEVDVEGIGSTSARVRVSTPSDCGEPEEG